jgi:hypothetical protein
MRHLIHFKVSWMADLALAAAKALDNLPDDFPAPAFNGWWIAPQVT